MKYITTRVGAIGATLATTGILAIGGVAAACPTNSQSSDTDNTSASATYSDSSWSNTSYKMNSDWMKWHPSSYMSSRQGDSDDWSNSNMNNNWMPSNSDWQ